MMQVPLIRTESTINIDDESYRIGPCWAVWRLRGEMSEEAAQNYVYERLKREENPVLIDVGAADGQYSLLAAYIPGMKSFSFEPVPIVYDILVKNIVANKLEKRVIASNVAISNVDEMGVINVPSSQLQLGLSTLGTPIRFDKETRMPTKCWIAKLDSIMASGELSIDKITVVKIDTEGCELNVVKGAEKMLKQYKPDIMFECNGVNTSQFGYDARDTIDLLMSWGWVDFKYLDGENVYCRYGN
jgi:FkbM family methyltransferase